MSTLPRPQSFEFASTWLLQGWRWWVDELRAMTPSWLQYALGVKERPTTRLIIGKSSAVIMTDKDPSRPTTIQFPLADHQGRAPSHNHAGTATRVELAPDLALITSLTLPETAAGSLRPIVLHQLEKLVPLDPASVVHDYRISARSETSKSLTVAVAIVKRATIAEALRIGALLGLNVQDIAVPTQDAPRAPPFVVWRSDQDNTSATRRRWVQRTVLAIGCASLLLAYGLHWARLQGVKEEVQAELAATRRVAEGASAVNEEARRLTTALQFLQARRAEVTPLQIIAELTEAIPPDSWVNQFSLRGRAAEVMGYSPRAADLIARLEQSRLLTNPRFRSAITMASDGRGERFHLSMELRQGAAP